MIYLFDNRENLKGILTKSHIKSAIQTEEINGIERLDLEINQSAKDKMKDIEFLAHKQVDEKDRFVLYKIITKANKDNTLSYTAINVAYDDFKGYGYIRERRMENTSARLALDAILYQSRWKLGIAEQSILADFYMYDLTRLEAISQLVETFNVELKFRITFNGNKITGRYVDLKNQIGEVTNKRFHYGTNALQVIREEKQQDIFTAAIGRGKGEEKFDTEGQATGGFGRRINFEEVEWKKSNGDPVDKPLGQEYVEIPELTQMYGYSDGTARYKIITHDKITEPEELLKACYNDLINGSRPLVQFKATLKDLGRISLGDRVNIIRSDLNIYYTARIFRIKRNLLDTKNSIVELGDNLEYNQAKKDRQFNNRLKELNSRVSTVASSAQETFVKVIQEMREEVENSYLNEDGYNYELKVGNPYNLPAGYYSFNAPIDQSPTKVIYVGAGSMMIANRKKSDGSWDWKTMSTGDGVIAETIVGELGEFATINATQINVNPDFYRTDLGKKVVIQDFFYNNVKITPEKGIQVIDANNRERVQLGNWATNRYGLKLTDQTGRNTILDDRGILQTWQDGRTDNIDNGYPLRLRVFVPREAARIYKSLLRIYVEKYRAYSKGNVAAGYESNSTAGGGYQSVFNSTSAGGGDYVQRTTDVDRYIYGIQGGHNHGLRTPTEIAQYHNGNVSWGGSFVQSGNHDHNFSFYIPQHYHSFNFTIGDHYHRYTVNDHSHATIYGIHEDSSSGRNMEIYINGTDRTRTLTGSGYFNYSQSSLDITSYLSIGTWNTIEIRCSQRARVDATVFIQALLNYGGY